MKQTRLPFFLFALFLALLVIESSGQDFVKARTEIKGVPPNHMNYNTFCDPVRVGRYKTACRLRTVPDVGLLVCHSLEVDGKHCADMIDEELKTLKELRKPANDITTVSFDPTSIAPLKCGKSSSQLTCTGYLVGWVDQQQGWFEHLSNVLRVNEVDVVINKVKGRATSPAALAKTADDLRKITKFMEFPVTTKYRQICDLQGFFINSGGFLVNDPDGYRTNMQLKEPCYSPVDYPTTEQVLKGLGKMISDFTRK